MPDKRFLEEFSVNSGTPYEFATQISDLPNDVGYITDEAIVDKADVAGHYKELISGAADDLINDEDVLTEDEVFTFRPTASSGRTKSSNKIIGGTLAWNQLVQNGDFSNGTTGWSFNNASLSASENVLTLTGNAENVSFCGAYKFYDVIANHKYIVSAMGKAGTALSSISFSFGRKDVILSSPTTNAWVSIVGIVSPENTEQRYGQISFNYGAFSSIVGDAHQVKNVQVIDLTLMFGTQIADYIYSLEQATAGAGVAWLKRYIDLDTYHEYNPGSLESIKGLISHDFVGFNQWDGNYAANTWLTGSTGGTAGANGYNLTDYIPVLPSTVYYGSAAGSARSLAYDADKNPITDSYSQITGTNAGTFTTPANASYIRCTVTNENLSAFIINLSDTSKNGTYEPYVKHSYSLDPDIILRGLPYLDSDNNLKYDGDIYESDGSVEEKYGEVDLGDLVYTKNEHATLGTYFYTTVTSLGIKYKGAFSTTVYGMLNAKYPTVARNASSFLDKTMCADGGSEGTVTQIQIRDSAYTDAATFKSAMSGVKLVYEKATPTSSKVKPYAPIMEPIPGGTERYESSSLIPIGQESKYYVGFKDKLFALPDKAESDGDYLVRQNESKMELTPFEPETLIVHDLDTEIHSTDQTPYNFRATPHGVGDREELEIVGVSVGWNQLIDPTYNFGSPRTHNGITFTRNSDGSITVNGTISGYSNAYCPLSNASNIVVGHVYYMATGSNNNDINMWHNTTNVQNPTTVIKPSSKGDGFYLRLNNEGTAVNNVKVNSQVTDLTLCFGPTIADYVYSLEQATAGSGVAWLRHYFPKMFGGEYHPYVAHSIESVSGLSAHVMRGFNQWDEEWEVGGLNASTGGLWDTSDRIRSKNYIPIIPDTAYYITYPTSGLSVNSCYYDADKNFISANDTVNVAVTTPPNAYFMKFATYAQYGTTYNHDITINFHYDGERDGTYEPYISHSYALDDTITLRGMLKLDSNNVPYADGDIQHPEGIVDENWIEYDLGDLTWSYESSYNRFVCPDVLGKPARSDLVAGEIVCGRYAVSAVTNTATDGYDKIIGITDSGKIRIKDLSYGTDAAAFKTAMSGAKLLCKKITPTTSTATPYSSPQICDNWGTEEFVSTSIVPVGHHTKYPASLKSQIEKLYGIPKTPKANGKYKLNYTVSNGSGVFSWESDS